ncbi:sugar phosphate isomerase/epimerase family protein [Paenibacillus tyrfis]|uniref:sugar phosphate isomerase/epimerase family protein n=1 Tax=Paenibacillus tyrfis TaxID=1501230 RepID=UPI00068FE9F2|nr:sugar phosphate isomerase/epimerase [Paenibacillus tyrfis]
MNCKLRLSCQVSVWGDRTEEAIRFVAGTGCPAVEIGGPHLMSYEHRLFELQQLLTRYGTSVSGVYEFGHFENWRGRRAIYTHHERLGRLMKQASIPMAVLGPGIRYNRNRTPEERQKLLRMITEIASRYEMHGVRAAIHPHWGHCIFDGEDIELVMNEGPAELGLVVDVVHTAEAGLDLYGLLERYGSRILGIHVKDYQTIDSPPSGRFRRRTRYSPPGLGEGNIQELKDFLGKMGYGGWVVLEADESGEEPEISISAALNYWRESCLIGRGEG